ncbi:MAG: hypothetical protein E7019_05465 [Alphaproteobacteria bacterium]|nr:hypothetical protein [Alphaproteobacteria bacterium]
METLEFNEDEFEQNLLHTIETALENAELFGASDEEKEQIKKHIVKTYSLNFLEQIREYLENLTNRSVAVLLLMLISLGVEFEDEEEILFWINKLERLALDRLDIYTLPGASRFVNDEKRSGLLAIISVLQKKNPEKSSFFKQIELALVGSQSNVSNDNKNTESFAFLQQKLSASGVEVGGRYWNHVINEYNMSLDKNEFVNKWTPNTSDIKKINALRGLELDYQANLMLKEKQRIAKDSQNTESYEKSSLKQENNKVKENELTKQKNKKLIEKEISNKKNRKVIEKTAEKKGKQLDIKDIQKMKIKVAASKGK